MLLSGQRSLWLIDGIAALVIIAIAWAVGWYAFFKPDTATSQMRALSGDLSQMRADLRRLRSALDRTTDEHQAMLVEVEKTGRLPDRSPIDQDLKTITALANRYGVKFLHVEPVPGTEYPSVKEMRYRVKSIGTYEDHLRFLDAFEQCAFWADVTYFTLDQTKADMVKFDATRKSELILSFYSATRG